MRTINLRTAARLAVVVLATAATGACTTLSQPSADLSGASTLGAEKGLLARWRNSADPAQLKSAKAIWIAPVVAAEGALPDGVGPDEFAYVAEAAAGAFCRKVKTHYLIAEASGPGVLSVEMRVTSLKSTNALIAAITPALPVRAPLGLGGISMEGEARGETAGAPAAVLVWSRQADPIFSGARMSKVGDAFEFASDFGASLGKLMVKNGPPRRPAPDRKAPNPCAQYRAEHLAASAFQLLGVALPPSIAVAPAKSPKAEGAK